MSMKKRLDYWNNLQENENGSGDYLNPKKPYSGVSTDYVVTKRTVNGEFIGVEPVESTGMHWDRTVKKRVDVYFKTLLRKTLKNGNIR